LSSGLVTDEFHILWQSRKKYTCSRLILKLTSNSDVSGCRTYFIKIGENILMRPFLGVRRVELIAWNISPGGKSGVPKKPILPLGVDPCRQFGPVLGSVIFLQHFVPVNKVLYRFHNLLRFERFFNTYGYSSMQFFLSISHCFQDASPAT
jgi:hypothetical protein